MLHGRAFSALITVFGLQSAAGGQCVPEWSGLDPPFPSEALTVWDEDETGPGRPVLVGAKLSATQGVQVGRYDGRAWRPIGEPLGGPVWVTSINALAVAATSGAGSPAPGLYAGGFFNEAGGEPGDNIAHWDGRRWGVLGGGLSGEVYSLAMFDEDGPGPREANLFVGGRFIQGAGVPNPGLLRWDGTAYSIVGGGLGPDPVGNLAYVRAMTVWDDDGPGPRPPALYVAGTFYSAGGIPAWGIARWDGSNWEALGLGLSSGVSALAVFDADGAGPEPAMLYAGGGFSTRDPAGNRIYTLARFNGTDWLAVPGWINGGVYALEVFDDDGDGPNRPALFVSGTFHRVARILARDIAKWDGQDWYALGSGLGGFTWTWAEDMQAFDEDGDPATPPGLYVGGLFITAGGISSPGLARWGCAYPACYADCDASTGLSTLDIFDFLCFQHRFVTADPYACDCDTSTGPNVCDLLDFLCFQTAFVGGCP